MTARLCELGRNDIADTLLLCWGNLSRGDDALGLLFAEAIEKLRVPGIEIISDYQLQIEYALDMQKRERLIFVDASIDARAPFEYSKLSACEDESYSSHALSPQALMAVYEKTSNTPAPPSFLLAIRGYQFGLGTPLSETAQSNLERAIAFIQKKL